MNGRCENDAYDQALDVCESCYGEFCGTCLLPTKARRRPLCKECAIAISGVRGGRGKIPPRGDRRTVKARRQALKSQGADDREFQYFDQVEERPRTFVARRDGSGNKEAPSAPLPPPEETTAGIGPAGQEPGPENSVATNAGSGDHQHHERAGAEPGRSEAPPPPLAPEREPQPLASSSGIGANLRPGVGIGLSPPVEPGGRDSAINQLSQLRGDDSAEADRGSSDEPGDDEPMPDLSRSPFADQKPDDADAVQRPGGRPPAPNRPGGPRPGGPIRPPGHPEKAISPSKPKPVPRSKAAPGAPSAPPMPPPPPSAPIAAPPLPSAWTEASATNTSKSSAESSPESSPGPSAPRPAGGRPSPQHRRIAAPGAPPKPARPPQPARPPVPPALRAPGASEEDAEPQKPDAD